MTTPEIMNLIGRAGVAFYFLWSVPFNVRARGHHLAEFQRIGAPFGPVLFSVGIFLALAGSLAFLYTPTAVVGGAMLIACPDLSRMLAGLAEHRIPATPIGRVTARDRTVLVAGRRVPAESVHRDELWRILEERA